MVQKCEPRLETGLAGISMPLKSSENEERCSKQDADIGRAATCTLAPKTKPTGIRLVPGVCDVSVTNACNAKCDFCSYAYDKQLVKEKRCKTRFWLLAKLD